MLLALLPVFAAGDAVQPEIADAKTVLHAVRSRFPADPVAISGTITVRRRRGVVVKEMGFSVEGEWSAGGADLTCVISDALGRESDTVDVSFTAGQQAVIKRIGDGLVAEDGQVAGTALNCTDLVMPFLWWSDAELAGKEKTRGRDSYILDLKPPGEAEAAGRVRVWIDSAIFIVLKAEVYDAEDKLLKQVVVKSFKKIDDRWMIKDLEVSMASAADKTVVTVDAMEAKQERSKKKDS